MKTTNEYKKERERGSREVTHSFSFLEKIRMLNMKNDIIILVFQGELTLFLDAGMRGGSSLRQAIPPSGPGWLPGDSPQRDRRQTAEERSETRQVTSCPVSPFVNVICGVPSP